MTILDATGTPVPQTPIKVVVAIPSGDFVPMGFCYDLTQLVAATSVNNPHIDIRVANIQGTIVTASRRDLVKLAQKGGADWILWLDSDMRFPRHTLVRLLSHDKRIVCANYCTRRAPARPVAFLTDDRLSERVYTEPHQRDLQAIASIGMGCMLTHISIFDELDGQQTPWFNFGWDTEEGFLIGEDVWFCRRVREELGESIWLDHGLSQDIRHVGIAEYANTDAVVARDLSTAAEASTALDCSTAGPTSETGGTPADAPADGSTS